MKKLLILLCLILVGGSIVDAGKSIPLDFGDRESYILALYKGDRVFFEFDGDAHSVILDDIKETRVEFDVFLYQNTKFKNKPPQYAFLDIYRDLKLDLDRDKVFDFNINIDSFDENKAIITFTKINEEKDTFMEDLLDEEKEDVDYANFIVVAGVIAGIIIVLFLIWSHLKGKKDTYY